MRRNEYEKCNKIYFFDLRPFGGRIGTFDISNNSIGLQLQASKPAIAISTNLIRNNSVVMADLKTACNWSSI